MTTAYYTAPHTPTPQPPSFPQTPSSATNASPSAPGTPLSGISTVAIKDGYEGNRHSTHTREYIATSGDRLARLGGFPTDRGYEESSDQGGYFERVKGWAKDVQQGTEGGGGETPTTDSTHQSDGRNGPTDGDQHELWKAQFTPTAPSRSRIGHGMKKSPAPGQIPLPSPPTISPKSEPSSLCSPMVPSPPYPTPNTPSIVPPQATVPSTFPQSLPRGSRLLNQIYQGSNSINTPNDTPSTNAVGDTTPPSFALSVNPTSVNMDKAPSPASTVTTTTTSSVQGEQVRAKMVDGMTYDEDVVDTTMSWPFLVNRSDEDKGEEMDGVESLKNGGKKGQMSPTTLASRMPGYFGEGSS